MATVASGLNSGSGFSNSDTVTSTTLNNHVNDATVTNILTADIASSTNKTSGVTFEKMQHISTGKVLGNASGSEGDVTELDIDTDLSSVSTSDDTVPSAKATKSYVDDNALKESILIFNGTTPITIGGFTSTPNGTQCTLAFQHLMDSAQSDPDTAATDINDAGITLSSNEFTLSEGTYDIEVDASITLNTDTAAVPGLSVIGFIKRKSDDNKILISNVLNQSDSVSQNLTLHSFIKGRIVIPTTPASDTNVFDLRFVRKNNGSALVGQEAPSDFESLTPPPNHVTVLIRKVKA